jgi:hypothetical protein
VAVDWTRYSLPRGSRTNPVHPITPISLHCLDLKASLFAGVAFAILGPKLPNLIVIRKIVDDQIPQAVPLLTVRSVHEFQQTAAFKQVCREEFGKEIVDARGVPIGWHESFVNPDTDGVQIPVLIQICLFILAQ